MKRRLAPLVVLATTAVVYARTLGYSFVSWDDAEHVADNPLVRSPASVSLREHLLTPALGYPIPVTILSYRVDAALGGLTHPGVFHATNVALHLVASWLVFVLARRLGIGTRGSTAAMITFALHPVCVEPVAWVSGRKDLLSLVFSLAAVCLVVRAEGKTSASRGSAVGAFALAMLSKPAAAYVAPWLAWCRAVRGWLLAAMVCVLALVLPFAFVGQGAAGALEWKAPLTLVREAWYALGFHASLLLLAREPVAKHLPAPRPFAFDPWVDLLPLALAAAGVLAWRLTAEPRRHAFRAGVAWAALAYVPVSGLVPLTRFVADVYVYAPLVGVGFAIGAALDAWLDKVAGLARLADWLLPLGAMIALVLLTSPSVERYRDSASLWGHVLASYPHDARVCRNVANAQREHGGPAAMLRATDYCIARFGPALFEKNRGMALLELGRYEESVDALTRARARRGSAQRDPVLDDALRRARACARTPGACDASR